MAIHFFNENIKFELRHKRILSNWIRSIIKSHDCQIGDLNFIYTSDDYILEINKQYLKHDYFTDIITFNYNEDNFVSGDIYISIDTVESNAKKYNTSFHHELYRVMIHGILHLIGFDDKTNAKQKLMRSMEDSALHELFTKFITNSNS